MDNNEIILKSLKFYLNYLENDDHAPSLDETKEDRTAILNLIETHEITNTCLELLKAEINPDDKLLLSLRSLLEKTLEYNDYTQGQMDALKYVQMCINHQRAISKTPDYIVALDDIALQCEASIQRLKNGENMKSLSTTMET